MVGHSRQTCSSVSVLVCLLSDQTNQFHLLLRVPLHPKCWPPVTSTVTRSSVYCGCKRWPVGCVAWLLSPSGACWAGDRRIPKPCVVGSIPPGALKRIAFNQGRDELRPVRQRSGSRSRTHQRAWPQCPTRTKGQGSSRTLVLGACATLDDLAESVSAAPFERVPVMSGLGSSADGPEFGEVEAVRRALRSGSPPLRSRQDRRRVRVGEIS